MTDLYYPAASELKKILKGNVLTLGFMINFRLANFDGHLSTKIQKSEGGGSGLNEYVENLFDKNLKWDDIKWLKR
jgi:isopentenyl diphosphate isomerase/L-lactate dehydrogenase-like FMN-dependent dehydrogenase